MSTDFPSPHPWDSYLTEPLGDQMPQARVLVTGGSGFIGTNLIQALTAHGVDVLNIDCELPRNPAQTPWWRRVDLLDAPVVGRVVREFSPEIVFHLAARTDLDETAGSEGYAANTIGVENLLLALDGFD